jgi:DNA polymerase-3 subunit alpha
MRGAWRTSMATSSAQNNLEVQDHHLEQDKRPAELVRLSSETGFPLVATNDSHYLRKEDARARNPDVHQTGKNFNDPNRMRWSTPVSTSRRAKK